MLQAITKRWRHTVMLIHVSMGKGYTFFYSLDTCRSVWVRLTFFRPSQRSRQFPFIHTIQSSPDTSHIIATEFFLMGVKSRTQALKCPMCTFMGHYQIKTLFVCNTHAVHLFAVKNEDVIILSKGHPCHNASSPIFMHIHWRIHVEKIARLLYRLYYHFIRKGISPYLMEIVKPTFW